MATITIEDVEHVALLSRLELTEGEKTQFARELSAIFDYVAQLDELDVKGVAPTSQAIPNRDIFRPDVVGFPGSSLSNKEAIANGPDTEEACFRVPPVIGG